MTRTPLALAALASAAVPGLDPATVEGTAQLPGHHFEVAFITDTQHRRWVVRSPMTAAAGAQMEVTVTLLGLLSRRLPFSVPTPKGFVALPEGGRAEVYPYLAGRPLDFAHLPAGPGIAAELGRALAALHNVDRALFDEAGLPSYDADTYRTRRLSDLDRAAATGHVPTGLLTRWEGSLEDVSLWRFAPTPTHGDLTGDEVLAVFDDDGDAATGRIRGLVAWEAAKVADPADDFAALVTQASPAAFDTVLEAYAHARVDRPDKYLQRRARLAGELILVSELLAAVGAKDQAGVEACAARLRELDADTFDDEPDSQPFVPIRPLPPVERAIPFAPVKPVVAVVPMPSQHADDDEQSDETVAITISDMHDGVAAVDEDEPADTEPADTEPASTEPADADNPAQPHRD